MATLESNVPIPNPNPGGSPDGARRYPFNLLTEPGLSLLFDADVVRRKLTRAAYAYARLHGWKVTIRALSNGQTRVWRIA